MDLEKKIKYISRIFRAKESFLQVEKPYNDQKLKRVTTNIETEGKKLQDLETTCCIYATRRLKNNLRK